MSSAETSPQTSPQTSLRGFQRKYLRKLAHGLKPVVHIGSGGISSAVLRALTEALGDHELVKVRLHEPEDKKALARKLAEESRAALCGLVGHTVILYRADPEDPKIELPARE